MAESIKTVKSQIEELSEEMWRKNPFFEVARTIQIPPSSLKRYLAGLEMLFKASYKNLSLAAETAAKNGDEELARFFRAKRDEELGHDQWARDDLRSTSTKEGPQGPAIAPESAQFICDFGSYLADLDPFYYLGYVSFSEYMTTYLGPRFLDCTSRLGLEPKRISALSNHVVLDVGHAEENFELIEKRFQDPAVRDRFDSVVRQSSILLSAFFEECAHP